MKASDLFVKALEAEHVHYVFGIPGEENLDLLESLRTSSIKLILTRHEQAAGFMAATYGRLTGKAGVCLATLGPGATNFVTAAAYAELGGMPMLMITGQKPIKVSKQGHFQIVDVVDMMKPLTKYTQQIVSADNIPARVREAFRRAEEERPGATHLELPEDIAHDNTDAILIPASYHRRPIADEKAIAHAVEAVSAARHPLLMIGAAANRKLCSKMLREFVDADRHSVLHHADGQGRDRRNPSAVAGQCGAVRRRLRASRHRARRLHHQCRPRRDRKAAILHATRTADGNPCQFRQRRSRYGLLPANRSHRRHRQLGVAHEGSASRRVHIGILLTSPVYASIWTRTSRKARTTIAGRSIRSASSPTCAR